MSRPRARPVPPARTDPPLYLVVGRTYGGTWTPWAAEDDLDEARKERDWAVRHCDFVETVIVSGTVVERTAKPPKAD